MQSQRVWHDWVTNTSKILYWKYPRTNQTISYTYEESWALKNWCFETVLLEKTLESPLGCKQIKPVNPKGNQSWIFIGLTDAKAETPILWQPDVKNWLIEKTLMLGTIGGGRRRGWDGWMASLTQWTWVWVSSGSWWWTRRPGVLLHGVAKSRTRLSDWLNWSNFQFGSVQSLSHVRLFVTPWIAARHASLSITNSQSSPELMSIESVMPSSHLILCRPLFFLPPIPPSIRVFSNESTLCMRWPKYWSFSFSIIPSKEHPGLISFRMD